MEEGTVTLSKDSVQLFWELLIQVRVSPMQNDAEAVSARVRKAATEIEAVLRNSPVANRLSQS